VRPGRQATRDRHAVTPNRVRRGGGFRLRSPPGAPRRHNPLTLLEYLAACHTGRDEQASTRALQDLFDRRWTSRLLPWARKTWYLPWDDDSYLGFLLDAWNGTATDASPAPHRTERGAPQRSPKTCSAQWGPTPQGWTTMASVN
jgi:hypothetical protein